MKTKKPLVPMKKMCPTCPFRKEGYTTVQDLLVERALNDETPICHSTGTSDITPADKKLFKESRACRGARDLQLKIFCAFGFLDEPTDEAWARKFKELQNPHHRATPTRQKTSCRSTGEVKTLSKMRKSPKYTHRDKTGMLWRFEGSRPVSQLADKVMAQVERDLRRTRTQKPATAKAAKS